MYIYIYIVLLVYAEDIIDPQINSCMLLLLDLLFVNSFVVFAFSDKKKNQKCSEPSFMSYLIFNEKAYSLNTDSKSTHVACINIFYIGTRNGREYTMK